MSSRRNPETRKRVERVGNRSLGRSGVGWRQIREQLDCVLQLGASSIEPRPSSTGIHVRKSRRQRVGARCRAITRRWTGHHAATILRTNKIQPGSGSRVADEVVEQLGDDKHRCQRGIAFIDSRAFSDSKSPRVTQHPRRHRFIDQIESAELEVGQ